MAHDSIDKMSKSFKEIAEIKAYSEAQGRTIIELNKKLNLLEQENLVLKRRVEGIDLEAKREEQRALRPDVTDEQAICEMQLAILRDRSLEGELTLEESKKVDIFTKLLLTLRNPGKKAEEQVKGLDTSELLKLVEGGLSDVSDKQPS
jgi:hypothetical protein